MLRTSKKLLYAIEAVVDIAYNGGNQPVRSNAISERQGIPRRYLEQVLQQLVREGILVGQRGPQGGYRLARERRRITVGEIVRIVNQLEKSTDPCEEAEVSDIGLKVVRPLWTELEQDVIERLDQMTVDTLCERARDQQVPRHNAPVPDFSI